MAERVRRNGARATMTGTRAVGTAALGARQQLAWVWTRESLVRLMLSFVLSLALWLYVTGKLDPSVARDFPQPLPVSITGLHSDLAVTNNLGAVYVRIKVDNHNGPISVGSFQSYVDLSNAGPGVHRFPIRFVNDPGISIVKASPESIRVAIVKIAHKAIPVRAHLTGRLPFGFSADPAQIQPTSLVISGPESAVSQVVQATAYVDLSLARSAINGSYRLLPEDSQGKLVGGHVSLSSNEAHIVMQIHQLSSYKTVPVLAALRGRPKAGYGVVGISVQPAQIIATGTAAALNRLSSIYTAPLSLPKGAVRQVTERVRLQLPKGANSSTHLVTVTVQIAPVDVSSSIEIGVAPINVAPGLVVHTRPAKILVTVVGPASVLRNAAERMRAVVDLTGYRTGFFQLAPSIQTSPGLQVQGLYPATVSVQVGL